jgi:hypothetical protein
VGFGCTFNRFLFATVLATMSIQATGASAQSSDQSLDEIEPTKHHVLNQNFTDSPQDRGSEGACCIGAACHENMDEDLCLVFSGIWHPGETCDSGICDGDGGYCSAGFILDCNGECKPISRIGDGSCDDGTNDSGAYFNCSEFSCDGGDCSDADCDLPSFDGACCTGTDCHFLSYANCVAINGTYMGEYTQCNSDTCLCPAGFIPDCDGNCIPLYLLGDGYCQHGEYIRDYPHIGEPGIAQFDLLCAALACDSGDCIGGDCIGACCIDAICSDSVTFNDCIKLGGAYQGALTTCEEIACNDSVRSLLLTDSALVIPSNGDSGNGLDAEGGIGFNSASHGDMVVVGRSEVQSSTGSEFRLAAHIYRNGNPTATQTIYPTNIDLGLAGRTTAVDTDGSRIVITGGIYAVVYVESAGTWIQEDLITSTASEFTSAGIYGDRLYLGQPQSNQVLVMERTGGSWSEVLCLTSQQGFGTTLSADAHTLVVTDEDTVYVYDTTTLALEFTSPIYGQHEYEPRFALFLGPCNDVEVDGDYFILGDAGLSNASGFGHLFKKTNGVWASHQLLNPTIPGGYSIKIGYAVALHDGLALVTAPQASEMEVQSGGAYLFGDIDGDWIEIARITQSQSGVNEGLGVSAAIGDQIWLGLCQNIYKVSDEDEYESMQVARIPDHLWINEAYGDVDLASNWYPSLPSPGSTATMNIQTSYTVLCPDNTLPFDSLQIGPGNPTLDLNGHVSTTISGGIDISGIEFMYSTLGLYQGTLTAQGPVTTGHVNRPGTLNIIGDTQLRAMGSYVQNELGTLSCQLTNTGNPALYVEGGLSIDGALKLTNDGNYEPPDGRGTFTVLESDQPPSVGEDQFKISIMPGLDDGMYYKLVYGDEGRGSYTVEIVTESLPVDGSFDSPDEIGVTGQATDILVADLFSLDGGLDGFADIALTIDGTPGQLYLFVNDGSGGISLQTTYPTGDGPTAITTGDINHDGIGDLIVTNGLDNSFQYWLNPSADATALIAEAPIATGDMPTDLIAFDIDSDLDDDVVITCAGNGVPDPSTGEFYGVVQFFESDGTRDRALTTKQTLVVNKQPTGIKPGDFDNGGDKDDDIIITLTAGNQVIKLANPGSDADWTIDQTIDVGDRPRTIEVLHIGGSIGNVCLIGNQGSNSMSVLGSDINGVLGVIASVDLESTPIGMASVDMDGDNDRDLAMLVEDEFGRDIRIYRNDTDTLESGGIVLALDDVLFDSGLTILIGSGDTDNDGVDDLVSITGSAPGLRGRGIETLSVRRSGQLACTGDTDGNGIVNVVDLLALISVWGPCEACNEDFDSNGIVNVIDLLALIGAWGDCP